MSQLSGIAKHLKLSFRAYMDKSEGDLYSKVE